MIRLCILLITGALLMPWTANAEDIIWLEQPIASIVAETHDVAAQPSENSGQWGCTVSDPADPFIVLNPVKIDADAAPYLYIKMAHGFSESLHIYVAAPGGAFAEVNSLRVSGLQNHGEPYIAQIDLRNSKVWQGQIGQLRLDFDGTGPDTPITLFDIGTSLQSVEEAEIPVVEATPYSSFNTHARMGGWHQTIVGTNSEMPHSVILTYDIPSGYPLHQYIVSEIVPGILINDEPVWPDMAADYSFQDFPGGVYSEYTVEGVNVRVEIMPLLTDNTPDTWSGAANYRIETTPPTPVVLRLGGTGLLANLHFPPVDCLYGEDINSKDNIVEIDGDKAIIRATNRPVIVGVQSKGKMVAEKATQGNELLAIYCTPEDGVASIDVSFANNEERLNAFLALDKPALLTKTKEHFNSLIKTSAIETPEPVMDEAFKNALLTMEYNWLNPYGWNECINHWLALWHMQHTPAAQWISQLDRARTCIESHAEKLLPNGAVPQFYINGNTRRDFGGSNQFYAWQLRHFWHFTGDKAFASEMGPVLDRVIENTWDENDPDNNGLLNWGHQIGNQEDFVSTPYDGTTPSIEGINMLRTRAELASGAGDATLAETFNARADSLQTKLFETLWDDQLGRFIFYRDPLGAARLDGQYQAYTYPQIYGLVDMFDAYTSVRHLRDRMTGPDGEVYASNQFANHLNGVFATWGMQAGAAQQPWGTWGLAAAGLFNEAYRPLKAVASWVQNDFHRGSWPEVATEKRLAYFSPPAALYIQACIEALFGLNIDRVAGQLVLSPSFPEAWPEAKLTLPEYSAIYNKDGNTVHYEVTTPDALERVVEWFIPVGEVKALKVNGKRFKDYQLHAHVGCQRLSFRLPAQTTTNISYEIRPAEVTINYPLQLAEGEAFTVNAEGCIFTDVLDRSGLLGKGLIREGSHVEAVLREGLLKDYLTYGRLGQMNFSRRSFFVACELPTGERWWEPIDIMLQPRTEAALYAEVSEGQPGLRLQLRNHTGTALEGSAVLTIDNKPYSFPVQTAAGEETNTTIALDSETVASWAPGDLQATLALPGGALHTLTFDSTPFAQLAASKVSHQLVSIALPTERMIADTEWQAIRDYYTWPALPAQKHPLLNSFGDKTEVSLPGLPEVNFALTPHRFLPVSWKSGNGSVRIDVPAGNYGKFYILAIPFTESHDMYAPVVRVSVESRDHGPVESPGFAHGRTKGCGTVSRTLYFPGDLDSLYTLGMTAVDFTTPRSKLREDRHGLLPLLGEGESDWNTAHPPRFPIPEYWATQRTVIEPSVIMNIIEFDLGETREVSSLVFDAMGIDPGLGIVSIVGWKAEDSEDAQ